ncbi:MAG: PP2C family protein-serine/threonine phosphatase [Longimicrobiales bacterium]
MSVYGDRSGAFSLQGPRRSNEDWAAILALDDRRKLACLADGMGGHGGGEIASRTAIATLERELMCGAALGDAVRLANEAVCFESDRDGCEGMGTTLVAVLRDGGRFEVANVGDSRAYWLDGSGITRLTVDHSFVTEAVRNGALSPQEAERSPFKHVLLRAVGPKLEVDVDLFGPYEVNAAGAVLLCSDGLHGTLQDEEIRAAALQTSAPLEAARVLAELAVARGTPDNVTVAILEFGLLFEGKAPAAASLRGPAPDAVAAASAPSAPARDMAAQPSAALPPASRAGRARPILASSEAVRPRRSWPRGLSLDAFAWLSVVSGFLIWLVVTLLVAIR